MHRTDFAPVLSATSNRDSAWIISIIPNLHQKNQPGLSANNQYFSSQSWARRSQHEPLTLQPLGRHFILFQAKPAIVPNFLPTVKRI
jgi:hypothetical protein